MTRESGDTRDGARHFLLNTCILLAAVWMACVKPAHADTTFLLQFGTFDTEELATSKWEEVKSKNADILGDIKPRIASVALPPSNVTTYRAQAGPVASREQATALCNSLQGRGVECYVVETAMFGSDAPPEQPQEPAKPAPRSVPKAIAADEASHADDPDYIPPPVDSGPVIISSSAPPAPAAASPAEVAEMPMAAPAPVAVPVAAPAPAEETPPPAAHETDATTPASANRVVPGRGPRFLDAPAETAVAVAAPPPPPPPPPAPPVAKAPESPGFFSRLFSSEPPKPAAAEGVTGSVNVAEAVRVPLSTDGQPPRQKIIPVLPQAQGLGGYPSESTEKTFWAQISYFRDETQALTFYRQFNTAYPQFSDGVRIRITRPFTATTTFGKVSLRVGPFAGTDDVRTICAAANRWNARCTVVRDLGGSSAIPARPHAAHGSDESASPHDRGLYWIQFGTFHSSLEAWEAWRDIKSAHRKLAGRIHPTVTAPPVSSAATAVFRLRGGPMSPRGAASLCNRMQNTGVDCLVVNDR